MRQARHVAMRVMEGILMRVCDVGGRGDLGGREDIVFVVGNDNVILGCSILEIEVR
jgi:predicted methyltransferase